MSYSAVRLTSLAAERYSGWQISSRRTAKPVRHTSPAKMTVSKSSKVQPIAVNTEAPDKPPYLKDAIVMAAMGKDRAQKDSANGSRKEGAYRNNANTL